MTQTSIPCSSHFTMESLIFATFSRTLSGVPGSSAHAYVGIHTPNLSLAILPILSGPPARRGGRSRRHLPVPELERRAAARHPVGPVNHAGRAACVHPRGEGLPLAQLHQLPREDPDLLPEVVRDRLLGLDPGREPEEARHVARLLVEREDLLLDSGPAGAA